MRLVPLDGPAHLFPTASGISYVLDLHSMKGSVMSGKGPGSLAIVRCSLGAVFLIAGGLKLADPASFYADLLAYEVALPDLIFRIIAVSFPWLEVLCGGALLANRWIETVGFLVVTFCVTFVGILGQAVWRGLELNCGCFGTSEGGWFDRPSAALGRATLLFGASVWWLLKTTAIKTDRSTPAPAAHATAVSHS